MRPEDCEQALLCQWLDAIGVVYFAVPNGAHLAGDKLSRIKQWKALERIGAKSGVPDLIVLGPPLAFVEMKRDKTSKPSEKQRAWHERLERLGYSVVVGYGFDDAREKLIGLRYGR